MVCYDRTWREREPLHGGAYGVGAAWLNAVGRAAAAAGVEVSDGRGVRSTV